MEGDGLPDALIRNVHRDLLFTHKALGNLRAVLRALDQDPLPVSTVLDVGCGHGGILQEVRRRRSVNVVGIDLRPPHPDAVPFPILRLDALQDPLPHADVAISLLLAHHLSEEELISLVRSVGRTCRRFFILDLVRHPLPLTLFRLAAPLFLSSVNVSDGILSVQRAYTPAEFQTAVNRALHGTAATVTYSVAPLYIRQTADISYPPPSANSR